MNDMSMEQQSRHESDTTSVTDEKEIHNKLIQILNLIGDESGSPIEAGGDIVCSEEEFAKKMAEEVNDESSEGGDNDLDLYQIQTDELEEEDLDFEAEMKKLAPQFFTQEEESKKEDELSEVDLERMQKAQQLIEYAREFAPSSLTGDHKCPKAGYYGGFSCTDAVLLKRLRSAATEIVKMIGKKIFSGKMDLTKISFPIKCMGPITTLELMPTLQSTMVVYLNKAAAIQDPVERMKLLMTHNISFFYKEKIFDKPLNPILGETYQALGQDGAKIYMEQVSHHPPISYFLIEGPNAAYKMTGWSLHTIKMGMTSANLLA